MHRDIWVGFNIFKKSKYKSNEPFYDLSFAIRSIFNYDGEYADFLTKCGILDIKYKKGAYYLTLLRPGIFIGRKGETIKKIERALNKKIFLDENKQINILYSFRYDY